MGASNMEIKGVVVEYTCNTCNGACLVKGAFVATVCCKACDGNGVLRRVISFSELKAELAKCGDEQ